MAHPVLCPETPPAWPCRPPHVANPGHLPPNSVTPWRDLQLPWARWELTDGLRGRSARFSPSPLGPLSAPGLLLPGAAWDTGSPSPTAQPCRARCAPARRQAAPSLPLPGAAPPAALSASRGRSARRRARPKRRRPPPPSRLRAPGLGGPHCSPPGREGILGQGLGCPLQPRPLSLPTPAGREQSPPPSPKLGPPACLINKADKI